MWCATRVPHSAHGLRTRYLMNGDSSTLEPDVVSKRVTFGLPWCANVTAYCDASVFATTVSAALRPTGVAICQRMPPLALVTWFSTDSRFELLTIIDDCWLAVLICEFVDPRSDTFQTVAPESWML